MRRVKYQMIQAPRRIDSLFRPSEGTLATTRRVTCLSFVLAALLAVFGPEQGRADTIVDGTSAFNFDGACSDCTGVGIGVLTVQNYTEGSGFSNSNFVSFTYNSNLIIDLSITVDTLNSFTGSIPSRSQRPRI
jgi:hypothetical protein